MLANTLSFFIVFLTSCISLSSTVVFGQTVKAFPVRTQLNLANVKAVVSDYKLVIVDPQEVKRKLLESDRVTISLPTGEDLKLKMSRVVQTSPSYSLRTEGDQGETVRQGTQLVSFQGARINGHGASLTIGSAWMQGQLPQNDAVWYIEPASRLVSDAPLNSYLLYKVRDVIPNENVKCGYVNTQKQIDKLNNIDQRSLQNRRVGGQCLKIDLAIASDFEMFTTYGSVAATEAFIVSVINSMETDYQNVFQEDVDFTIVEQFVSTTNSTSLETSLTSSTSANTLLTNFSTWGQGTSGFTNSYDLSQIWVERDIVGNSGSLAVGVARTPGICSQDNRVAIFENFSSTAWQLRVLASHETGHNFGITHDALGSTFIMAPSVSNTTTWSAQSITQFESHVSTSACLSGTFSLTGSPKTDFELPGQACVGEVIQVENSTGRNPTSFSWTFTNGTPTTSTATNPTVSFASTGANNVSLVASNTVCGSSVSVTETNQITIISNTPPIASACVPNGNNSATGGSFGIGVYGFSVGTINNSSGGAFEEGSSYTDYNCEVISSTASFSLPVTVTVFNVNPQSVEVFIDLNNDGNYSANEELFSQSVASSGTPTLVGTSGTMIVPSTVVRNQILRTRVIANASSNQSGTNGCSNDAFQEVEDYGLIFTAPLPVDIVDFSAKDRDDRVALSWSVANELDLHGYQVEHRTDLSDWETVGRVNAAQLSEYAFDHTNPILGTNYYRLTSIDLDGSFETTRPIAIKRAGRAGEVEISPNPMVDGQSFVRVAGFEATAQVLLETFDTQGRLVATQATVTSSEGDAVISLDLKHLPKGLYAVRTSSNGLIRQALIQR